MYIKVSIKISIKVSIKNLYKSLSKVERNQTSYTRHSGCGRILIKRERDGKNLKLVAWCFLSTPQVQTRRGERKQCYLSPANTNASKVQTNKTKREKHSATSDNVSSHLQILMLLRFKQDEDGKHASSPTQALVYEIPSESIINLTQWHTMCQLSFKQDKERKTFCHHYCGCFLSPPSSSSIIKCLFSTFQYLFWPRVGLPIHILLSRHDVCTIYGGPPLGVSEYKHNTIVNR